ncbi:MAG TPA: hypothetical protein VIL86_08990 [Tepidisphaeraceae bacterium]|jgi:hypothetical protein
MERSMRLIAALCVVSLCAAYSHAAVTIKDRAGDTPLVLDQATDYVLNNVSISGLQDTAALTLSGRINSVAITNSRFGDVRIGANGRAAAMECAGALVGKFSADNSSFYDAENELASFKQGAFGTVTFKNCTFRTSESFLRQMYMNSPWRLSPPVTEFYNIERLELLDNTFINTIVIIHPSVKQVILRGDTSGIHVESADTQVILLNPGQPADAADPSHSTACAQTNPADTVGTITQFAKSLVNAILPRRTIVYVG